MPVRTLVEMLESAASSDPDRVAFTFLADGESDEASLTYAALAGEARRIAAQLSQTAIPGARAVLMFPHGLDFVKALFGTLYAGLIAVPVFPPPQRGPSVAAANAARIAENCDADIVLTSSDIAETRAQIWQPDDPFLERAFATIGSPDGTGTAPWVAPAMAGHREAIIQYTSGSTGAPKGVTLSHENVLANEAAIQAAIASPDHVRFVSWLPQYHDMGLIACILHPVYRKGSAHLLSPMHFIQKPARWLRAVTRYRAFCSGAPNFAYELCVRRVGEASKASLDLSSWRVAFNGSEPVRPDTLERFAQAFEGCGFDRKAIFPCYGLAESALIVSGGPVGDGAVVRVFDDASLAKGQAVAEPFRAKSQSMLASSGAPAEGQYVRIADRELRPVPDGVAGEICVRGASVAAKYWKNREATEQRLRAHLAGEAGVFLRTGDTGFMLDGQLYVLGRDTDLINIRGRNLFPQDVESAIQALDSRLRFGSGIAFGMESDDGGTLVIVQEVKLRDCDALDGLISTIRACVAQSFQAPVYDVLFVDPHALPKTPNGKLRRRACKQAYVEEALPVIRAYRRHALIGAEQGA